MPVCISAPALCDRRSACGAGTEGVFLDNLTIALCISIGTGVPWLMAIFTRIKLPAS